MVRCCVFHLHLHGLSLTRPKCRDRAVTGPQAYAVEAEGSTKPMGHRRTLV